jgi:NAD(P)-dependent dehydrogenase (short-subunit alcohol dehydrogenase family)
MSPLPLAGHVALVTGVSRSIGIGYAVARRLEHDGATVFATGWTPHDDAMPWGRSPIDGLAIAEHDMADSSVPARLIAEVVEAYGATDTVAAVLHQMTATLAAALGDVHITANCINPGPVDTGWAPPNMHDEIAEMFPTGRWGQPDDVANLVSFLVSDAGAWMTGQVLNSEGGFRRHQNPSRE